MTSSAPRILYVITRPERGGAQSHLLELLRGIGDPAHLTLVSGDDQDLFLHQEAEALGIRTVVLNELVHPVSPVQDLRALLGLWRLIRQIRPDLVHAHSSKAGLLARLAARLAGVPSVFTAHGWAFTEGAGGRRRALALALERLGARAGTRIIAVSDYDRNLGLRLGVGRPSTVTRIYNALPDVTVPDAAARPGDGDRLRVVMVARFAPPKRQLDLIRAAAQVPDVHLTLVGDGPGLEDARALATSLGSDAAFLGSRRDVAEILAGGDVFCLISDFEGFPISTLEAMRAGLAVIVSEVGGAPEALVDGSEMGLTVPKGDEGALTLALSALAADRARTRRMGERARAVFLERFQVEEMLEQTRQVYRDVLP